MKLGTEAQDRGTGVLSALLPRSTSSSVSMHRIGARYHFIHPLWSEARPDGIRDGCRERRQGQGQVSSRPGPPQPPPSPPRSTPAAPSPLPAAMLLLRIWAGLSRSWYAPLPRLPPPGPWPWPLGPAFSGMAAGRPGARGDAGGSGRARMGRGWSPIGADGGGWGRMEPGGREASRRRRRRHPQEAPGSLQPAPRVTSRRAAAPHAACCRGAGERRGQLQAGSAASRRSRAGASRRAELSRPARATLMA